MDKLAEGLGLLQHLDVHGILLWHALEEPIHVEPVNFTSLLSVGSRRSEKLPVGVEETGKASNECSSDLIRIERGRTGQHDHVSASGMNSNTTIGASEDAFIGLLFTD